MRDNKIRWIHLSDLHSNYKNYDTISMRNNLFKYLKQITESNSYDFVAITGDITYKYGKFDNELIEKIEECCRVPKDRIYLVPGNHDIKRDKVREAVIDSLDRDYNVKDIYVGNLEKEIYDTLIKGQKKFWKYHKDNIGNIQNNYKKVHSIIRKDKYNIICMNTCFFSGKKDEEGNLVLGLRNHIETLSELNTSDNKINIAIGHHGIDCFHENERNNIVYNFLDNDVDLYMCGHVHNGNYKFYNQDFKELPVLTSGSLMIDGYAKATFITGELNLDSKECEVQYHSWIDDIKKWDLDNTIGRKINNQKLKFELGRFKKKDTEENLEIDEDEFQEFIIEFIDKSKEYKPKEYTSVAKDVYRKLENMLCMKSTISNFDELSKYFFVIDGILLTNELFNEKRLIIDNLITDEYRKNFHKNNNGDEIIDCIINGIYEEYRERLVYSKVKFKFYIKILIYWMINFCSIFNEKKVL
ncbi:MULTISPECIES: metallophosphoesterase [unclassified Clostridium]|uniref:metallophosphoesterase family protein n=3 Tax=Clostridium TaxID=1485 RepID=UPI0020795BF9|nr:MULTISPECIES: metallophosphoesterase [unclassified Clostridium]